MRCAGCRRELDVGDRYIKDKASGFIGRPTSPEIDGLIAEILGSDCDGSVLYCEDCTEEGGEYMLDTVYGDEDSSA
jgi:hypothetical protein